MTYRRLKMNHQAFRLAFEETKIVEIRLDPDGQKFFIQEIVDFLEYEEVTGYSGRAIRVKIMSILGRRTSDLEAFDYVGLENGFVCLSLEIITRLAYQSEILAT
jgi:hypothetical protein